MQRWCIGLATLLGAVVMATASSGAPVPINPNVPIPGVKCSAGTTQVTDTVARLDGICIVPEAVWRDVICQGVTPCEGPPDPYVKPKGEQIPVPPDDPKGPVDLCIRLCNFDPDGDPPDLGPGFHDCQTDPALEFCSTDPYEPPSNPDPNGPKVIVDDKTKDPPEPSKSYHCDPHTWTSSELVYQASITLPGETEPIDAYLLNPSFPTILMPEGDSSQDPPIPSFLDTKDGTVTVDGKTTPYWLDDPRADSSAYVDTSQQGCISVPDTAPTQLSADGLGTPTADLPDAPPKANAIRVTWAWSSDNAITDLAVDGGSEITGYEAHAFLADTGDDAGKYCVAEGIDSTGCIVSDLVPGTNYVFKVRAINGIGAGPWTVVSDPPIAVTPPSRKQGLSASVARARRVTAPGTPTKLTIVQCETALVTAGQCASINGVRLSWAAPRSNGGKPITGYVATVRQVDSLLSGKPVIVKTCRVAANVFGCNLDGLRRNFHDNVYITVSAINAKGTGTPAKPPKSKWNFNIKCADEYHQTKCYYTIRIKVIIRVSGRDQTSGLKTRIGCQLAPFVARATVYIRNPAFGVIPGAPRQLMLGEAMNGICRVAFIQVKRPVLTAAQKALRKKGYTVMQMKIVGLGSKGTREVPIGLPWAITRVENKNSIPINGGRDPRNNKIIIQGDGKPLQSLKVLSNRAGVITWIGVVKKKGYYPIVGTWPFYKPGKTFFTFPKSRARK